MPNYTLTYSPSSKGWVSFYSYNPDFMIGMNNYFYSFKGGNLYRHNTNEQRGTFYGVFTESTITSVFNESPLINKLFKTLNIEGDDAWDAQLYTDLQSGGFALSSYFEKKEQSYFSFIRNSGVIPASTDLKNGINQLIVDTTVSGGGIPSIQNPYTMYIKNSVAESHGLLGHYCVFTLTNDNTSKVELFALESEVMKSYP